MLSFPHDALLYEVCESSDRMFSGMDGTPNVSSADISFRLGLGRVRRRPGEWGKTGGAYEVTPLRPLIVN